LEWIVRDAARRLSYFAFGQSGEGRMAGFGGRIAGAALALGLTILAPAAQAQSSRTWVSGVGDDANPCSRVSPCKTFAGAISKTAAGGEIDCLDPGAFGGVTITKSISIVCEDTPAGVLATGGTGFIINAGANDIIVFRGLTIDGGGTGTAGIKIFQAARVEVHDSVITDFRGTTTPPPVVPGYGISVVPGSANIKLLVSNTTITGNTTGIWTSFTGTGTLSALIENSEISGNTSAGISYAAGNQAGTLVVQNSSVSNNVAGISLSSSAGAPTVTATVDGTLVNGNSGNGINVNVNGGTLKATVVNSTVTNNNNGVSAVTTAGSAMVSVMDSTVGYNAGTGVATNGPGSQLWLSSNVITANGEGYKIISGTIYTYGDNRLFLNLISGTGSMTPVNKQ
jgi:hypothetical protein